MRAGLARGLSVAASLALVAVVTFWESQQRVSPGGLHPAHQRVIDLAGRDGCELCHGSGELVAAATTDHRACVHCHAAIGAQLDERRGLHGALRPEQAGDCGRCHPDHHGADSPLVTAASFALAGVPRRDDYRHQHIAGYPLVGVHAGLECRQCHEHADDVEVPRGGGRFLGLSSSCTACHEDHHDGGFGSDCATCHGQEQPFAAAPGFRHEELPLAGAHLRVGCDDCHPPGTPRGVEHERIAPQPSRRCMACHESPHNARFLVAAGRGGAGDCGACHDVAAAHFAGAEVDATTHAAAGFPLEPPHAAVRCEQCHDPAVEFARRFPGRLAGDCRSCHADTHRGQFDDEPRYAQCTACHDRGHFVPPSFDLAAHARTAFPLDGAHAAVGCRDCHRDAVDAADAADAPRRFAGTPANCGACHDDVHRGLFDGRDTPAAVQGRRECARCHTTAGFDERPPWFDHGWTGFALDGEHAAVKCNECHSRSSVADAAGRFFAPARGRDCALCHADVHYGQFAVEGRIDCARCHTPRGFEHGVFDHQTDSRFPLDTQHRDLECGKCHPSVQTDRGPIVRYRPLGRTCGDCHVLGTGGDVVDGAGAAPGRGSRR